MASHFLFTGKPWLQEKTPRLHLHPTWDLKASKSLARFPYTPLESLLAPISAFHPTYLNSAAPSKAQSHPVLLAAGVGGIVVRCPSRKPIYRTTRIQYLLLISHFTTALFK
ncbi:Schizosaccharomyces pombe specific protein [Schizosaccharomyces pombe]|uniref:Uncharacterized protein C23C11.07 n=1 Tax=Schizosaccharomyces pombe (strain 972 / ATCC 24843) TaxID=284812 RepID=YDW7_SCHPO|nr:uncharacterized protein SPAC23C11.07 [Schizosaccharomyces pombe]O13913.1 RecName: Full=Uncharacterized protein C23C11.07 [Schizosaccharomyces pombe 972h-]CAB11160.1 sequence orphan [Schizosaccharomyces pombe]|eukprot:NP_593638.1 uncharacterized protein SPAC23C11.07 [Schizosaccharomyces pombe]